jgi:hypothetical protein
MPLLHFYVAQKGTRKRARKVEQGTLPLTIAIVFLFVLFK